MLTVDLPEFTWRLVLNGSVMLPNPVCDLEGKAQELSDALPEHSAQIHTSRTRTLLDPTKTSMEDPLTARSTIGLGSAI